MERVSRRTLLQAVGVALLAVPLLEACGGAANSATQAAAAKAAALASSASSVAASASQTTTAAATTTQAAASISATATASSSAAAAAAAAPGAAKTPLSIAVWVNGTRTWQGTYAQKWADQNPNVNLTIVKIPYANIEQKTLVEIAANTLQDVVFTQCKSLPKLASDGAYLALDSLVSQHGSQGTTDFFPAAVANGTLNGKLWGIPFEINTGNTDIIFYNKDLLAKFGAPTPTDDWTYDQFVTVVKKASDVQNRIWGTDLFPGTYYDFDCYARSYGGQVLSSDGKTFQLSSSKECLQAAQWLYDLRTVDKVAPSRQESQNLAFPAGQISVHSDGIQSLIGLKDSIGTKFQWDVVLGPTATTGLRGYELFSSMWAMYSKTKQPELGYSLITFLNSPTTQTETLVSQGQPPSRISVWESKEAASISPIWGRIAEWLKNPKDQGPFPMPYNFKYAELEDKWENVGYALWYGETSLQSGLQTLEQACQGICSEPR